MKFPHTYQLTIKRIGLCYGARVEESYSVTVSDPFYFHLRVQQSTKSELRQTRDTLLESLRMKKPPRIEELSKVIPGELKKHTVSRAMVFVGILSSRQ